MTNCMSTEWPTEWPLNDLLNDHWMTYWIKCLSSLKSSPSKTLQPSRRVSIVLRTPRYQSVISLRACITASPRSQCPRARIVTLVAAPFLVRVLVSLLVRLCLTHGVMCWVVIHEWLRGQRWSKSRVVALTVSGCVRFVVLHALVGFPHWLVRLSECAAAGWLYRATLGKQLSIRPSDV